jgi:zinc D-Ala-D-Ala dipeptidase
MRTIVGRTLARHAVHLLLLAGAGACGHPSPAQVANTAPAATATDQAAESLLVDVLSLDSTISVEARYATAGNFTGAVLPGYEANRALLRREAATALARVQAGLRREGLGLRIYDGYRPVRATLAMVAWAERTGQSWVLEQGYVARRSRHNQGVAVDLTLIDLATGRPLEMGTPFDTFSAAAHTANASGEARRNRERLKHAMEAQGFSNYDQEWWHYIFPVEGAMPFDLVIR